MKAIVLMFDSLNRHMLPNYGCSWTHAPNFARLGQKSVTFDRSYVCSMPCMPARRDLHTGRPNFLHRSWGPIEPFDDSVFQILRETGISTHLISDHYHYWEDGGATYHGRYSTWQFNRGQEGDAWMGQVEDPDIPACVSPRSGSNWRQDWINRQFIKKEEEFPQARTFAQAEDFLRRNGGKDQWLLQIETFDPHEPFFSHQRYKDLYPHNYQGPHFDWPPYQHVTEPKEVVEHCRMEYAALLSMCDNYMGKVLDLMDELDLWKDTLLIVCTDHGFMLGEHNCWAKIWMPFYEEVAHTPFWVWDPRTRQQDQRRSALVQPSIDLAPTLLEFFGLPAGSDMLGQCLRETVARDTAVREAGIFGVFGGQVNVTDGRYVYMRGPANPETNTPLFNYTLMPTHMRGLFAPENLRQATLAPPFSFTKGVPLLKVPGGSWVRKGQLGSFLWDVVADPQQQKPLQDRAMEERMLGLLLDQMRRCDTPAEQYERLGLPSPALAARSS